MLDPADEKVAQLLSQTDAQMQRLGWTVAQGKEHLQKYYGVRSRLQLTEEELDNFLLFLQLTDTPEISKRES
ncbi:hypothetical protein [Nostoc sp. CCY 9925]|uniref:hypothetical protein n=1 Tax=Nostoc sp. CCY 9925 TaxID=3103865 RepID=UPI0039C734FA